MLDRDVDFVVTIDSDTVLEHDALVRVVEPLLVPDYCSLTNAASIGSISGRSSPCGNGAG
jgi:cellulose synthase/poly-beta-1,6-N-acetylglucosamine synthase-like glycosyltransferase